MATRPTLTQSGKFFIHGDTSLSLNQGQTQVAKFLNSRINQDYRALIRADYDIETISRDSLDISMDDKFIAKIDQLAREYPSMKQRPNLEKHKRPKTIHLMVVKENENQPETMEGLGYVNQTHHYLDHVVTSAMTSVTPGVYPVLVTDTNEPIEAIHFDPDQTKAVPLAGPNYQAETLGPSGLPGGDDDMSRNRLRDLMKSILSTPDYSTADPAEIKVLRNETFNRLPRIAAQDNISLLIQNFRALIYQILYDNDLFNNRLKINDLPQVDQNLLKNSLATNDIKATDKLKKQMSQFIKGETVDVDKNFFAYLGRLVNLPTNN
ncbi:MAG: hypothetical protein O2962_08505 [Cyanobacteria bacterium]|nr:hypothetical protein [Cyanobacteriota bacterium]